MLIYSKHHLDRYEQELWPSVRTCTDHKTATDYFIQDLGGSTRWDMVAVRGNHSTYGVARYHNRPSLNEVCVNRKNVDFRCRMLPWIVWPHLNAGYCSLRNSVEFEIRGSAVKLGFRLFYIILFLWIVSVLQPWQESHCLLNGITIVEREIIFNNEITQGNQLSLNCSCSQQGMDLVSVTPNKILCYTRPFC